MNSKTIVAILCPLMAWPAIASGRNLRVICNGYREIIINTDNQTVTGKTEFSLAPYTSNYLDGNDQMTWRYNEDVVKKTVTLDKGTLVLTEEWFDPRRGG
jgi:hypothetical protein